MHSYTHHSVLCEKLIGESSKGMIEPISTSIAVAISLLVKSSPNWLPVINDTIISPVRDALIGKLVEKGFDKGLEGGRKLLRFDAKEQSRHLELALKNAAERGLANYRTKDEQNQYSNVLTILSESGSHNETLRREALLLFTLDSPDLLKLNILYNDAFQVRSQSQTVAEVNAVSYLSIFFEALIAELYADPFFRQQMSRTIQDRAAISMQRSLKEVIVTLHQIGETFTDEYTPVQFENDIHAYTKHIEMSLRYLKLVGVVPKERTYENTDPELDAIYVPLSVALKGQNLPNNQTKEQNILDKEIKDSTIDLLAQTSCLVLLGDPGSGKSTTTRHLAWSHAVANLSNSTFLTNTSVLPGKPLPLRIELRRLTEDRRQHPNYDFLTYASEVLLGRAGLDIPRQMFDLLLERRTMLILFEGLDEVATLADRKTLVDEIESFVQRYPGNHFLVTSRKVGYYLASFSAQSFSHGEIQPFNDEQIRLFLERWYTYVLRLSPISPDEQEELEELYVTLKEDRRFHPLAENPLLLTMITALHHYERLPDRRIKIYDRCADLLMETWSKLKGTDARWKDLKLSKEDQYACVAHLGFILHERPEEKQEDDIAMDKETSTSDFSSDVSPRFLLQEIERYLKVQNLFPSKAEVHTQARRLLELIQEETGLIVERGTDANNEPLYGFMHRTFQEYFAAADVYERYQQEEEPTIISEFLKEHLHDPHWSEVILLLLGKLKHKPATAQLRQILERKIQSRRSKYNEILQQDLFFISSCLIEEISIENDLARNIIYQLSDLVQSSPFPSQRSQALANLGLLMQTRQYASFARKTLLELINPDVVADTLTRTRVAQVIYDYSLNQSDEKLQAVQMLLDLTKYSNLTFQQNMQIAQALYNCSAEESEQEKQVLQMLLELAQRPDSSFQEVVLATQPLYQICHPESAEVQRANQILSDWVQQSNLQIEQVLQTALILFLSSPDELSELRDLTDLLLIKYFSDIYYHVIHLSQLAHEDLNDWGSEIYLDLAQQSKPFPEATLQLAQALQREVITEIGGRRQSVPILVSLAQRPNLSFEQSVLVTRALYQSSAKESQEEQQATQALLNLLQLPNLSFEQSVLVAHALYQSSAKESQEKQQATQALLNLLQLPNLSFEESLQATLSLYTNSSDDSIEENHAKRKLSDLVQWPDLSFEQTMQIALSLFGISSKNSTEEEQAIQLVSNIAQQNNLSIEQTALITEILYLVSSNRSTKERTALQKLLELTQQLELTFDQRLQLATLPISVSNNDYQDRVQAVQVIQNLLQPEVAKYHIEKHWQSTDTRNQQIDLSNIPSLAELSKQELLPTYVRDEMYQILRQMVPQFDQIERVDVE
jgi:hypothetical protein